MNGMESNTDSSGPLKVFIVEDSVRVRELLMDFLHVPGELEVVGYADTEQESIEALTHTPVDAAVVDLRLKQGSGLEVIDKFRQIGRLRPGQEHPARYARQDGVSYAAVFCDCSAAAIRISIPRTIRRDCAIPAP